MKLRILCLLGLVLIATPCFAQDALTIETEAATESAESVAEPVPDTPAASLSQKLIRMTDQFVAEVAAKEGDCDAMRDAFVAALNQHREFMASLDYATEQADESVVNHIHENAIKLGTLLGACYNDDSIESHLLNAMKR